MKAIQEVIQFAREELSKSPLKEGAEATAEFIRRYGGPIEGAAVLGVVVTMDTGVRRVWQEAKKEDLVLRGAEV